MLNVILTGATGAVGQELLPRLLENGHKVFCIIRPKDGQPAEDRLRAITKHPGAVALSGDITDRGCGVDLHRLPRMDKIIHCAADVRFDEKFATAIEATNVGGTRNVLALADVLGVPEVHYVGTTYVAGDAKIFGEQSVGMPLETGMPRNTYESTKGTAERMMRNWRGGRISIYRPSIVVGRAKDGVTTTFDGFYGFFKGLWKFRERGQRYLPIVIQAIGSTPLNLIQADWLAETMAQIIELPARGETYNLAHPSPMNVGDVIQASLPIIDIAGVTVQKEPAVPTGGKKIDVIQKMVSAGLERYAPYVTHGTRFICENARRDLGTGFRLPPPITPEFLQKTLGYAIDVWRRESKKRGTVIRLKSVA